MTMAMRLSGMVLPDAVKVFAGCLLVCRSCDCNSATGEAMELILCLTYSDSLLLQCLVDCGSPVESANGVSPVPREK